MVGGMKPTFLTCIAIVFTGVLLNSCRSYIGQRAHERAEYVGFCLPADISSESGRQVLSDGRDYYIELPRYRKMPRALNWIDSMGTKFCLPDKNEEVSGEPDFCRLHPELARYVIGRSNRKPSDLEGKITLVDNPDEIRPLCTERLSIVNSVDKEAMSQCARRITSPNATAHKIWGYTATVLLDAPITVVQNTALAAGFGVGFVGSAIAAPIWLPIQQHMLQPNPKTESPAKETPVSENEAN